MTDDNLVIVPDLKDVKSALESNADCQVQFDSKFEDKLQIFKNHKFTSRETVDAREYIEGLNELCAEHGSRLNVRFYGHYGDVFDGDVLTALPDVASLTINCISDAVNLERVETLTNLEDFSLGVFELNNKKILKHLPYAKLTHLCLEECKTTALDLSFLESAVALKVLKLFGHKKGVEGVGQLSTLRELVLNPKKKMDLGFINQLTELKALKFVLGGMEEFDAIALPALDQLAVTMVLGLQSLGDLSRFPELRQLLVQDQKRIESIRFSNKSKRLANVGIRSCKSLTSLPGLSELPSLESLSVGETKLDVEDLEVPPSVTHMAFTTGTTSGNRAAREFIEAGGLIPEEHPSMPFFYK